MKAVILKYPTSDTRYVSLRDFEPPSSQQLLRNTQPSHSSTQQSIGLPKRKFCGHDEDIEPKRVRRDETYRGPGLGKESDRVHLTLEHLRTLAEHGRAWIQQYQTLQLFLASSDVRNDPASSALDSLPSVFPSTVPSWAEEEEEITSETSKTSKTGTKISQPRTDIEREIPLVPGYTSSALSSSWPSDISRILESPRQANVQVFVASRAGPASSTPSIPRAEAIAAAQRLVQQFHATQDKAERKRIRQEAKENSPVRLEFQKLVSQSRGEKETATGASSSLRSISGNTQLTPNSGSQTTKSPISKSEASKSQSSKSQSSKCQTSRSPTTPGCESDSELKTYPPRITSGYEWVDGVQTRKPLFSLRAQARMSSRAQMSAEDHIRQRSARAGSDTLT